MASQFLLSSQSGQGFRCGLSSPVPPVRKKSHSACPRFVVADEAKEGRVLRGVGGGGVIGGTICLGFYSSSQ